VTKSIYNDSFLQNDFSFEVLEETQDEVQDEIQDKLTEDFSENGRHNPCASFLMLETLSNLCNEQILEKRVVNILSSLVLEGDDGQDDSFLKNK
jgi:hypothetical protein